MGEDMIFLELRLANQSAYSGADWGDIIDIANAKGLTVEELLKIWKGEKDNEFERTERRAEEGSATGGA